MSKLLAEFLQEQQEPFALEVYLLERGYCRGKKLNASYTLCRIKKQRYVVPNCTDFLKAVFSHFINDQKLENSRNGGRKNAPNSKSREENAVEDRFSSLSSTTLFNSCSEKDVGGTHCLEAEIRRFVKRGNLFLEGEVDGERKLEWRADEDSKQLSPISVLEETESDEDSPIHNTQGESSNSISQCKLKKPMHYSFHRLQQLVGSNSYEQYIINKRALQQRKQLLIDSVGEVIEKHNKREKSREELKKMLGAEELWKLVCENVWMWSQETINESSIVHLLHCDFLASEDEWNADFEKQKMEISKEVENAILEDVINEILTW